MGSRDGTESRRGLGSSDNTETYEQGGLIPWREFGTYALAQVPQVLLGSQCHTKDTEAVLPKSRLKLPSFPPSSLKDHPMGEEASMCLLRFKRGQLPRAAPALTDAVHPRDQLILAQVLAGMVVSWTP